MDILKPETYWVGDRCYRLTGGNSSNSITDTVSYGMAPFEDMDDEQPDYEVSELEGGWLETKSVVPNPLFCHIVGSRGATKNKLQQETGTRILIPRQNQKGPIIIQGRKYNDVVSARRRIERIASQARMKKDVTHFACFSFTHESVIAKFLEFKEKVISEHSLCSRGIDASIFQRETKLHATICVCVLLEEEERSLMSSKLQSLEGELREISCGKPLVVHLKGLEIMNDDPKAVHVLYVNCQSEDSKLKSTANIIATRLFETEFCKKSRGDDVKLHCTLMNTRYRADTNGSSAALHSYSRKEPFDATVVLEKFADFDFGTVEIDTIHIFTRHTMTQNGLYKSLSSVKIA